MAIQPFYAINTVRMASGLLQHDEGLLTDIDCPRETITKLPDLGLIAKWKVSPDFTKGRKVCSIRDVQAIFHDADSGELQGYAMFHIVTGGADLHTNRDYLRELKSRGDAGEELGELLVSTFGNISAVLDEMESVAYVDVVEFVESAPAGVGLKAFMAAMVQMRQQYGTRLFLFSVHPLQFNNQYSKSNLPEGFVASSATAYQSAIRKLSKIYKANLGAESLHGNVLAVSIDVSLIETDEGAWAVMSPEFC